MSRARQLIKRAPACFSLVSGSSGNAIYISSSETAILVDAGMSCKKLTEALAVRGISPDELSGILITHEHSDHVAGLNVLAHRWSIPVYLTLGTWQALEPRLTYASRLDVHPFISGTSFVVGDLAVHSFQTPHDASDPVGYRIDTGRGVVSVFTDLGEVDSALLEQVGGSDIVYIEANYDPEMLWNGPYPWPLKTRIDGLLGHLSNMDSAAAIHGLLETGSTRFVLSHLSDKNNYPELAERTVSRLLEQRGAVIGRDLELYVAPRYRPGDILEI